MEGVFFFFSNVSKLYSGKWQGKLCIYIIICFYSSIEVATGLLNKIKV